MTETVHNGRAVERNRDFGVVAHLLFFAAVTSGIFGLGFAAVQTVRGHVRLLAFSVVTGILVTTVFALWARTGRRGD